MFGKLLIVGLICAISGGLLLSFNVPFASDYGIYILVGGVALTVLSISFWILKKIWEKKGESKEKGKIANLVSGAFNKVGKSVSKVFKGVKRLFYFLQSLKEQLIKVKELFQQNEKEKAVNEFKKIKVQELDKKFNKEKMRLKKMGKKLKFASLKSRKSGKDAEKEFGEEMKQELGDEIKEEIDDKAKDELGKKDVAAENILKNSEKAKKKFGKISEEFKKMREELVQKQFQVHLIAFKNQKAKIIELEQIIAKFKDYFSKLSNYINGKQPEQIASEPIIKGLDYLISLVDQMEQNQKEMAKVITTEKNTAENIKEEAEEIAEKLHEEIEEKSEQTAEEIEKQVDTGKKELSI